MIRHLVSKALRDAGYRVVTAVDGIDALDKLAATPDTALVVCDLRMPRMNGHELLEAMHRDGVFTGPTVVLTTDSGIHIARARARGVRGCLLKPFQETALLSLVGGLVLWSG